MTDKIIAHYYIPDVEHEGDIEHFKTIIIDNGGEFLRTVWSGELGDDCYIIFKADSREHRDNIFRTIINS